MRLLVTRPEPEATAFAAELYALGHRAVVQPLLRFEAMDSDGSIFRDAGSLLVTSANAFRALQAGGHLDAASRLPLFAVGARTAKRARNLGFSKVLAVAATGAELVTDIAALAPPLQPLVHLSGRHRAFDFAAALKPYALTLRTETVYAMEATPALDGDVVSGFGDGSIDGVILMSARTAKVFVSHCMVQAVHGTQNAVYFCLSEPIARELAGLAAAADIRVPERPTKEALLDLLFRASPPCGHHD